MFFTKFFSAIGGSGNLDELVEQQLRDHKGKYIFQAFVFIVSGIMAATLSSITAIHTELLIGVILMVTGLFQLALTFKSKMHWWSLLSAGLSIVIGTLIVWKPFVVLISVVTLLAIFMTLESLFELFLAFRMRLKKGWGWMVFSSAVTLIMAFILWIGYPTFDVLYLGWIVGINMILYGLSLLMLVWGLAA